jgi:hypothetical protein
MLTKFVAFVIFLFLVIFDGMGQSIIRAYQEFEARYRIHNSIVNKNNLSIEAIAGSPYFNDDFVNGEIYINATEKYIDVPLRYNMYLDEIEFKLLDETIYNFDDPSKIYKIRFNDHILIYSEFDSNKKGFLFVLYEGKSALYERKIKNYSQRVPSKGIIDEKPPQFTNVPIKFYIKLEGRLPQSYNSRKDLLDILTGHSSEINNFLKKEKIKINDPNGIIKLLSFHDSL